MDFAIEYSVPVTVIFDSAERRVRRVIIHDDCLSEPGSVHDGDDVMADAISPKRRAVVLKHLEASQDAWPSWEFGW